MKLPTFLAVLFAYCLLFLSCQHEKSSQLQVLKVNTSENTRADLSDFVVDTEMIKLETTDSCLLSYLQRMEITPEYIFVSDNKNLFQFGRNGTFIRKIGRNGRGPNEYQSIGCFTCSTEKERIYIGTLGKILCFDFNGNFIKEIKENKLFDYLKVNNKQLWAFFTDYGDSGKGQQYINQNKVYQYSLDLESLKDSLVLITIMLDHQVAAFSPNMQYLSETSDRSYIYCPVLIAEPIIRDTLYYLHGNKLTPAVKVDFGDIAVTTDKAKNFTILSMNRTQRYLFAEYNYKQRKRLFLFDFSTGDQYNLTEGFSDDIFGAGKVMLRPLDIKSNLMYCAKDAYELKGIIDGVHENDNPVLMLVKLKE